MLVGIRSHTRVRQATEWQERPGREPGKPDGGGIPAECAWKCNYFSHKGSLQNMVVFTIIKQYTFFGINNQGKES